MCVRPIWRRVIARWYFQSSTGMIPFMVLKVPRWCSGLPDHDVKLLYLVPKYTVLPINVVMDGLRGNVLLRKLDVL